MAAATACSTALDCAVGSICVGAHLSAVFNLGANLSTLVNTTRGSCHTCASFDVKACPETCFEAGGACTPDALGLAAGLPVMQPYYFLAFSAVVKPLATMLVMGPTQPFAPKSWGSMSVKELAKQVATLTTKLGFIFMAMNSLVDDVSQVRSAVKDSEFGWSYFLTVIRVTLLVWSTSSNLTAYASMAGLNQAKTSGAIWAAAHETSPESSELQTAQGELWRLTLHSCLQTIYTYVLAVFYALPFFLMVGISIVPLVLYCYLAVPLAALFFFLSMMLSRKGINCITSVRGTPDHEVLRKSLTEEEKSNLLKKLGLVLPDGSYDGGTLEHVYEINSESYRKSGVLVRGWENFFFTPAVSFIISVLVPVAVRLFTGYGYWNALTATLSERHLETYMLTVVGSVQKKVDLVWVLL